MYHLFISGYKKEPELDGFGGYLVHLISKDLKDWKEIESLLTGQVATPECSDYFQWNGWYYLLYSTGETLITLNRRNLTDLGNILVHRLL